MTAPDLTIASAGPIDNRARTAAPGVLEILEANGTLLIAVALLAAYVRPLLRSLWVDEAGTFWAAREGPVAAIAKIWHWPGQSILYSAITSFFCFSGSPVRDQLLRLPALLGAGAACYFLYRFAEDIFGAGAGRIAAVLFLFSPPTIEFATQARPYAMAMAAAAASCWTLYRWTRHRERSWLVSYIASLTLVLYLHYMFAVILAAHAALLICEAAGRRRFHRIGELVLGYAVVAVLLLPVLPHLKLLFREAHTLPYAGRPSGQDLAAVLMPSVVIAGVFVSGLLVHFASRRRNQRYAGSHAGWNAGRNAGRNAGWNAGWNAGRNASRDAAPSAGLVAMLIVLWAAGPLLSFVVSNTTSAQIFVPRYVSYSGLALVLLLTYTGYSILGARAGFSWALLAMLLTTGNPMTLAGASEPAPNEIGPAMRVIRDESAGLTALPPVLARSDYTEADYDDWRAGNVPESHLFSPFVAYPMRNQLLPLPYRLIPPVKDYVDQLLSTSLKDKPKVIFLTRDVFFIPFMEQRFERAGFTYRWMQLNNYYVVIFERRGTPAQP